MGQRRYLNFGASQNPAKTGSHYSPSQRAKTWKFRSSDRGKTTIFRHRWTFTPSVISASTLHGCRTPRDSFAHVFVRYPMIARDITARFAGFCPRTRCTSRCIACNVGTPYKYVHKRVAPSGRGVGTREDTRNAWGYIPPCVPCEKRSKVRKLSFSSLCRKGAFRPPRSSEP